MVTSIYFSFTHIDYSWPHNLVGTCNIYNHETRENNEIECLFASRVKT